MSSNHLSYISGKHSINFDPAQYNFKSLLLIELNKKLLTSHNKKLDKLENLHQIDEYINNQEMLRQLFFQIFRDDIFPKKYKSFALYLIDSFFDDSALVQRTPTIRIQYPKANSTSFHCDGWYGHSSSTRSFWIPLMEVNEKNSLFMANNLEESKKLMNKIIEKKYSLSQINDFASKICNPFLGNYGDILTFSHNMIHGTNLNTDDKTRISFDFRINENPNNLGTKPRANYYNRDDLLSNKKKVYNPKSTKNLRGISYSNLCSNISAKTQLDVCSRFAVDHGIEIDGNESEILIFSHLPVLEHYIQETNTSRNCIIVFGIEIFNRDKELASIFYRKSKFSQKKLIFAAQGRIFDPMIEEERDLLDMLE